MRFNPVNSLHLNSLLRVRSWKLESHRDLRELPSLSVYLRVLYAYVAYLTGLIVYGPASS